MSGLGCRERMVGCEVRELAMGEDPEGGDVS